MENVNENFNTTLMYLNSIDKPIKKIKVTSDFYNYLESKYRSDIWFEQVDKSTGYISKFTGIPIVVDDGIIGDHYELEF